MFIEAEEDSKECDYVFFFNSNMEFKKVVTPEIFLPTAEDMAYWASYTQDITTNTTLFRCLMKSESGLLPT